MAAGDGHDLLIGIGEFGQRFAENFRIGRRRRRRGLAGLALVFAQAMELVRLFDGRLVAFAFLGQDVQQDRLFLRLEKFESAGEKMDVVSVDRAVIAQAQVPRK